MDRKNPLRETADVDLDIPLHSIDQAEFNPKNAISGQYRRGLSGSLGTFALRDRLKVWPNPRSRGRYIALDGNQRLDVLREMIEDHLASLEAARLVAAELAAEGLAFDPAEPEAHRKRLKKAFEAVRADDAFMADARARASSTPVPCRVLADLSPDDAKLFTIAFNRNQSKFDEVKLSGLCEEVLASRRAELGEAVDAYRKKLEAIARPEKVMLPPPPPPPRRPPPPAEAEATPGGVVAGDEADQPWGPPPPDDDGLPPASHWSTGPLGGAPPAPPKPLIPVMFSLTPAGHDKLQEGLLRCKSRPIREARLVEAFARLLAVDEGADLSSAYAETLLICLVDRIAIAEHAE